MIPNVHDQRVPVLRFVEAQMVSLEWHHSVGVDDPEVPTERERGRLPVTNQVTTPPDHGRCSQTLPDKTIALTCRNAT